MSRRRIPNSAQPDLLEWTPPVAVARFDDGMVRAGTIAGQLCRAISAALNECGTPRAEVARLMSEFLGQTVSKNMLDAYASQAREDHAISVPRFVALLHALRDRRLLEMVAEQFGWAVIERRHLPLIELAAVQDRVDVLKRSAKALRNEAKIRGGL